MIRKIMATASLSGLLLGTPAMISGMAQEPKEQQQQQQETKSISGKITDIGDQGHSFTLDTGNGGEKQVLKFMVDKNTQVQGQVKVGSVVAVDYQALDGGQLLCVRVASQS
jgi:hypothetical protein